MVTKWSLPARVVGVSSNGFRIHVRNLLDWTKNTYTKDQVRIIISPTDENQIAEWQKHIEEALRQEGVPSARIKRYLQEILRPQAKIGRFDTSSAAD